MHYHAFTRQYPAHLPIKRTALRLSPALRGAFRRRRARVTGRHSSCGKKERRGMALAGRAGKRAVAAGMAA